MKEIFICLILNNPSITFFMTACCMRCIAVQNGSALREPAHVLVVGNKDHGFKFL